MSLLGLSRARHILSFSHNTRLIPVLSNLGLATIPSPGVRAGPGVAHAALKKIDPEAAAKAGVQQPMGRRNGSLGKNLGACAGGRKADKMLQVGAESHA
jgi:hypothetical protein